MSTELVEELREASAAWWAVHGERHELIDRAADRLEEMHSAPRGAEPSPPRRKAMASDLLVKEMRSAGMSWSGISAELQSLFKRGASELEDAVKRAEKAKAECREWKAERDKLQALLSEKMSIAIKKESRLFRLRMKVEVAEATKELRAERDKLAAKVKELEAFSEDSEQRAFESCTTLREVRRERDTLAARVEALEKVIRE